MPPPPLSPIFSGPRHKPASAHLLHKCSRGGSGGGRGVAHTPWQVPSFSVDTCERSVILWPLWTQPTVEPGGTGGGVVGNWLFWFSRDGLEGHGEGCLLGSSVKWRGLLCSASTLLALPAGRGGYLLWQGGKQKGKRGWGGVPPAGA